MKSRKLRALALALSAIMTITAVPSTLFAEDFVGEVDAWDDTEITEAEAPVEANDFGFDAQVEEAPVVAEEIDFFAADELVAADKGIKKEEWNSSTNKVKVTYLDDSYKEYSATAVQYSDDCTKDYLVAEVDDGTGKTITIQSNIPKEYFADTYSSDVFLNNANVTEPKEGLIETTRTHDWNEVKEIIKEPTCTDEGEFVTKYVCKNTGCKVYSYTKEAPYSTTKPTSGTKIAALGHKKPATGVTTSYIVSENSLKLDGSTSMKNAQGDDVEAINTKNASAPVSVDASKDASYAVKYEYVCPVCNAKVTEYEQVNIKALLITYLNFKNLKTGTSAITTVELKNAVDNNQLSKSGAPVADLTATNTSGIYGSDKDFATLLKVDCTSGKAGSYLEVWHYTDGTIEKTIEHTLAVHGSTTTYFTKADPAVDKDGIVTATPSNVTAADGYKVETDAKGKVTAVLASTNCKAKTYYEVVVCDYCGKKMSVTKQTAPGNDEAHRLSENAANVKKALEGTGKETFNGTQYTLPVTKLDDIKAIANDKEGALLKYENITATCTEAGTVDVLYACSVCGKFVALGTYKIDALGHDWKWVDKEIKEPTCTEDGYVIKENKCSRCGLVNEAAGTQKLTTAKLNHKNIKATDKIYIGINEGGDIVDQLVSSTNKYKLAEATSALTDIDVDTTEIGNKYQNNAVVGAYCYQICPDCGAKVDITKAPSSMAAPSFSYEIVKVNATTKSCNNGDITIKVSVPANTNPTLTNVDAVTGTYDYWRNNNAYQARTQHAPKENADGSIVCVICGKVIKEAPVVTTVAPTTVEPTTVVTTEAPTTVAPTTVAPTTVEPSTVVTTEAPTTVAPVTVEPTTEITTVEPATMPAQVTGEKITKNSPTTGTIGVKYNAVEGADSYTVNVREPNGEWKKNPTNGAETAYDITGLTEGKCYDIRIAAVAAGIAGPRSGHLYRWLKKVTLMKPTKIKGEAGAVNVTWDAADGATKYKLYVSSDKAFKKDVQKIKVIENTAKVTGLQAGTKYYFKVRCYTKGEDGKTYTGGWSNVKSKTLK